MLRAWRDGDRDAGDELISRYLGAAVRFFRSKLGDDVQDLVQRTFLDLLEASDKLDLSRPVGPYLFSIARHRLYDELRKRHGAPAFDPASSSLADLDPSPSQVVARSEETRLLKRALRRISLDHQVVLELFYWEGLRGEEIATAIEVSPHTVRSRLARAKAALRVELEALAANPALCASTLSNFEAGQLARD